MYAVSILVINQWVWGIRT